MSETEESCPSLPFFVSLSTRRALSRIIFKSRRAIRPTESIFETNCSFYAQIPLKPQPTKVEKPPEKAKTATKKTARLKESHYTLSSVIGIQRAARAKILYIYTYSKRCAHASLPDATPRDGAHFHARARCAAMPVCVCVYSYIEQWGPRVNEGIS